MKGVNENLQHCAAVWLWGPLLRTKSVWEEASLRISGDPFWGGPWSHLLNDPWESQVASPCGHVRCWQRMVTPRVPQPIPIFHGEKSGQAVIGQFQLACWNAGVLSVRTEREKMEGVKELSVFHQPFLSLRLLCGLRYVCPYSQRNLDSLVVVCQDVDTRELWRAPFPSSSNVPETYNHNLPGL